MVKSSTPITTTEQTPLGIQQKNTDCEGQPSPTGRLVGTNSKPNMGLLPQSGLDVTKFAEAIGYKLYDYQKSMIAELLKEQQLIVGMDFGRMDQTVRTTATLHDDNIVILDIEAYEPGIRGMKPTMTIIDDYEDAPETKREAASSVHKGRLTHVGKTAVERLNQSKKAKQELLNKFWAERNKRG